MSTFQNKEYLLQLEATKILERLVEDPGLQIPKVVKKYASEVEFHSEAGLTKPYMPTPLKFTESSASLWGLIAAFTNALIVDRYGAEHEQKSKVSLDKSSLYLLCVILIQFNGKMLEDPSVRQRGEIYDKADNFNNFYRTVATNIYQTKDNKFFHLHGSMNATKTLKMLGLPPKIDELQEREKAVQFLNNEVKNYDSEWLDVTANERYRQAGSVCYTAEEFANTEQGRVLSKEPLYLLYKTHEQLPSVSWPEPTKGTGRPLEGIKVIDFSRVIAAPQISKILANLGASVIRVSNNVEPDMALLLFDSNLGKKDVSIDLKTSEGKEKLEELILECDVFVDGYRPGVLAKLGFSQEYVQFLAKQRNKGIVFTRENCYGFKGPWLHRSGWQQIADAVTGAAYEQGKFLGLNEPVQPLLPNSDLQVALVAVIAILNALYKRRSEGGSYNVDVSLCRFDTHLLELGLLPLEEQQRIKSDCHITSAGQEILSLRHHDDMFVLLFKVLTYLVTYHPSLFTPHNFSKIESKWGEEGELMTYVKSPPEFSEVNLSYDRGSCPIGTYLPQF